MDDGDVRGAEAEKKKKPSRRVEPAVEGGEDGVILVSGEFTTFE